MRFKPDAISRLLNNANIAYVQWNGNLVIILPVLIMFLLSLGSMRGAIMKYRV
ncbi:MAG: hypothetical protein LBS66_04240 [Rhodospirillaceae bacterium]|nr:hypothetical protein [Rhodospirillaceae bacterium]